MANTASSMPACRSPSSANRAGTVAIVKSPGSTSSISSQRDRGRHACRRARRAPSTRRPSCGRGRSGCSRRTAAAGSRSLRHQVVVTSVGRPPLDLAGEGQRRPAHVGEPVRRARCARRRACPCRPRSSASRRRRARRAPRGRRGRPGARVSSGQSGIGSRSIRHSSGFSVSARREFHGMELDRRHLHRPDHVGRAR